MLLIVLQPLFLTPWARVTHGSQEGHGALMVQRFVRAAYACAFGSTQVSPLSLRCALVLAFVVLGLSGSVAWGQTLPSVWQGRVSWVTDGDTLWVTPRGDEARKLRLLGLDAPEICQAYGAQAKAALEARVLGQWVRVSGQHEDDYGRLLARVELIPETSEPGAHPVPAEDQSRGATVVEDSDVGRWLVQEGHAWADRYRGSTYLAQEAQARRLARGLFAQSDAEPPRAFRRRHGPCLDTFAR